MESQVIDLQYILVGGILGMLGQGIRMLIGLKKLSDDKKKQEEEFSPSRIRLTIFIGFVTGGVAAVVMQKPIDQDVAFSLIAIGYLGVDFLEGLFLQHIMPIVTRTTIAEVTQTKVQQVADQSGIKTVAEQSTTSASVGTLPGSVPGHVTIAETPPVVEVIQPLHTINVGATSTGFLAVGAVNNAFTIDFPLLLSASIGLNMPNRPADVFALKQKFHELGYTWTPLNDQVDKELYAIINLFQSIIRGRDKISGDSVITVPSLPNSAYGWLQADNAPKWTKLDAGSLTDRTLGYVNDTLNSDPADYYGTDWLISTIQEAGQIYYRNHLKDTPAASIIYVNDLSEARGVPKVDSGPDQEHLGHRTGLLADIRLPRTDGKSGGITIGSSSYDQNAARQIIKAFRQTSIGVHTVLFNDTTLRDEGLCHLADSSHDTHIHVHIKVPPKLVVVHD